MSAQVAHLLTDEHQIARRAFVNSAFARDDLGFQFRRWVIKIDCHKTLACRLLQILENGLIAGVVRNHQHEIRRRVEYGAALFNRQPAAMVRQWMDDDDRVLTRFDYFIEITNRAIANRRGQWTI